MAKKTHVTVEDLDRSSNITAFINQSTGLPDISVGVDSSDVIAPGSDGEIIFNDAGSFGSDSTFVYDKSNDLLKIEGSGSGLALGDTITNVESGIQNLVVGSDVDFSSQTFVSLYSSFIGFAFDVGSGGHQASYLSGDTASFGNLGTTTSFVSATGTIPSSGGNIEGSFFTSNSGEVDGNLERSFISLNNTKLNSQSRNSVILLQGDSEENGSFDGANHSVIVSDRVDEEVESFSVEGSLIIGEMPGVLNEFVQSASIGVESQHWNNIQSFFAAGDSVSAEEVINLANFSRESSIAFANTVFVQGAENSINIVFRGDAGFSYNSTTNELRLIGANLENNPILDGRWKYNSIGKLGSGNWTTPDTVEYNSSTDEYVLTFPSSNPLNDTDISSFDRKDLQFVPSFSFSTKQLTRGFVSGSLNEITTYDGPVVSNLTVFGKENELNTSGYTNNNFGLTFGSGRGLSLNYKDEIHTTVIGEYNTIPSDTSSDEDRLFIIGNGTGDSDRSNALEVISGGSVNILTTLKLNDLSVGTNTSQVLVRNPSTNELEYVAGSSLMSGAVNVTGGTSISTFYNASTDEFTVNLNPGSEDVAAGFGFIKSSGELVENSEITYEGNGAVTFGGRSGSVGSNSFTVGSFNEASGVGSVAFGIFNDSTGESAFTQGTNVKATAPNAVAFGRFTEATNNVAAAFGGFTVASGFASLAAGSETVASGLGALATGSFTRAGFHGGAAIGNYNEDVGTEPGSISGIAASDRVLQVGAGDNPSANSGANDYFDGRGRVDSLYVTYRDGTHVRHGLSVDAYNESLGTYESVLSIGREITSGSNTSQVLVRNPSTKELEYVDGSLLGGGGGTSNIQTGIGLTSAFNPSTGATTVSVDVTGQNAASEFVLQDASTGELITLSGSNLSARYGGNGAFTFGKRSGNESSDSIVIGDSEASGFAAIAIGRGLESSGNFSVTVGRNATATANDSAAIGRATVSKNVANFTVGTYNEDYLASKINQIANLTDSSRIFAVGVGDGAPAASPGDNIYYDGRGEVDGLYVTYRDGTHVRHGLSVDAYNASLGQYETVFEIDETGTIVQGDVGGSVGLGITEADTESNFILQDSSTGELITLSDSDNLEAKYGGNNNSFTFGYRTGTTGNNSIVFGGTSTDKTGASGQDSIAIGRNVSANDQSTIAIGGGDSSNNFGVSVSEALSIGIGADINVNPPAFTGSSYAIGRGIDISNANRVVLGQYNANDYEFTVGNGVSDGDRSDLFYVREGSDGSVVYANAFLSSGFSPSSASDPVEQDVDVQGSVVVGDFSDFTGMGTNSVGDSIILKTTIGSGSDILDSILVSSDIVPNDNIVQSLLWESGNGNSSTPSTRIESAILFGVDDLSVVGETSLYSSSIENLFKVGGAFRAFFSSSDFDNLAENSAVFADGSIERDPDTGTYLNEARRSVSIKGDVRGSDAIAIKGEARTNSIAIGGTAVADTENRVVLGDTEGVVVKQSSGSISDVFSINLYNTSVGDSIDKAFSVSDTGVVTHHVRNAEDVGGEFVIRDTSTGELRTLESTDFGAEGFGASYDENFAFTIGFREVGSSKFPSSIVLGGEENAANTAENNSAITIGRGLQMTEEAGVAVGEWNNQEEDFVVGSGTSFSRRDSFVVRRGSDETEATVYTSNYVATVNPSASQDALSFSPAGSIFFGTTNDVSGRTSSSNANGILIGDSVFSGDQILTTSVLLGSDLNLNTDSANDLFLWKSGNNTNAFPSGNILQNLFLLGVSDLSDFDFSGPILPGNIFRVGQGAITAYWSGNGLSQDVENTVLLANGSLDNGAITVNGSFAVGSGSTVGADNAVAIGNITISTSNYVGLGGDRVVTNTDLQFIGGTLINDRLDVSSTQNTDGSGYYSVDTSSGNVTLTIQSSENIDGKEINVKNNGSGTVTIETAGSSTIDDSTNATIPTDNNSVTLVYNSTNDDWEIY
jgi:X-X-X-Leu-X-X-Gly heptad repeat protein